MTTPHDWADVLERAARHLRACPWAAYGTEEMDADAAALRTLAAAMEAATRVPILEMRGETVYALNLTEAP